MKVKVKDLLMFKYNNQIHIGISNNKNTHIKSFTTGEVIEKNKILEIEVMHEIGEIMLNTTSASLAKVNQMREIIYDTESKAFQKFAEKMKKHYIVRIKQIEKDRQKRNNQVALEKELEKERNF